MYALSSVFVILYFSITTLLSALQNDHTLESRRHIYIVLLGKGLFVKFFVYLHRIK